MKRLFDICVSFFVMLIVAPFLIAVATAIFLYDFRNPLYVSTRVGKDGRLFKMVKLRSMIVNADRTGVTSTSTRDTRITPIGRFVRKLKLDEFMQLWNVLIGDMSLVGPRPNVPSGVAVYTTAERHLLDVRPGITDFASIVFADEGEILGGYSDADVAYDQLIRPWKSRLGLLYVRTHNVRLDAQLLGWTAIAIVARSLALQQVQKLLLRYGATPMLANVALRRETLRPNLPPGPEELIGR